MASLSVDTRNGVRAGSLLLAALADRGTAAHRYATGAELTRGPDAARNLADAVHFLCTLHGRHPGVVDHAVGRTSEPTGRAWLMERIDPFASERLYLTRLAVAAGPVPSTPGAGDSDAVVLGQRHAIDMLAQSERHGCALGAAFALVADWETIRAILDRAAARFGVDAPVSRLDDAGSVAALADACATGPGLERAILFGAQQILVQHHGLWDLLEARHLARAG